MKNSLPESNGARPNNAALEKSRILLWDVDGTLMRSTVQGGYRKYFAATMRKVFGSAGILEEIIPSGMTDTQIMFEALRHEGFTSERILENTDNLLEVFEQEMTKILAEGGEPYEILPGAREILEETDKNPKFFNALLTGNLSVAAKIKLSSIGLWHYFKDAPNAFGEISHRRNDLAIEAGKLFNERYNFDFSPQQFIVIGDTPNDIACARAFGAKVIAVASGRNHPRKELEEYEPDVLLDDLKDMEKLLEIIENL
ncbi:MAG TPA: HAD hydrolase-like protein [Pyrinomonadaceae bacterium]|nr:HAD hydrolase-like protein [Pyrinomonadaceae bacterium]